MSSLFLQHSRNSVSSATYRSGTLHTPELTLRKQLGYLGVGDQVLRVFDWCWQDQNLRIPTEPADCSQLCPAGAFSWRSL